MLREALGKKVELLSNRKSSQIEQEIKEIGILIYER
jgi:hypothetical protein